MKRRKDVREQRMNGILLISLSWCRKSNKKASEETPAKTASPLSKVIPIPPGGYFPISAEIFRSHWRWSRLWHLVDRDVTSFRLQDSSHWLQMSVVPWSSKPAFNLYLVADISKSSYSLWHATGMADSDSLNSNRLSIVTFLTADSKIPLSDLESELMHINSNL